jgi:predicted site-specific integrase-resolvase
MIAMHDSTTTPPAYTEHDLAPMFRRSVQTIRRWARLGKIPAPAIHVGGTRYWSRDTVARMLGDAAETTKAN